jgi:hypothetical protein
MSLLSAFLEALHGDPVPLKPIAAEFPDGEVSRAFMEATRERRALKIERDCFRAELLRLGYTERSLNARLQFYGRALKAEVRAS